jgi:hypothetical protein
VPLDLVLASIRSSAAQQREVEVNLDPPRIFYSQKPAILVMFMGEPQLKPVADTSLMFAINTNWDMFYDAETSRYFLLNQDAWLTAEDPLKGPWTPARSVPASFSTLPDDPNWAEAKQHLPGKPATKVPVVFTSTAPAEMILVDGEPAYSPVPKTKRMYMSNTASIVFLHTGEKQYYYQVADRWFRAKKLAGPWSHATTDLPQDFARIPEDYPLAPVRASVPGTEEAKNTILLASVPTQAEVQVGQASPASVAYEGTPKFEVITNTTVSYAVNTPNDVFVVDGPYGSAGAWAGYNPATGTYARGGYASGPYASAGWGAAYNPYTGTPSRGGYASGARGSVYAQSGYNPSTGTSGTRAGYSTPYGSGGRGYVQQGDEWAQGGYRSTAQGTVAGVQTSQGGVDGYFIVV